MVDTDIQLGATNCLDAEDQGTPIYKSNPSLAKQLVCDIITPLLKARKWERHNMLGAFCLCICLNAVQV